MNDRFLRLLGLARRAGKAECGEGKVLSAVKSGRALALIIASDASNGTKKKLKNSCGYYGVPSAEYAPGEELGAAVGMEFAAAVAVTDENFAAELLKLSGFDGDR